jgi:hypothetical protein
MSPLDDDPEDILEMKSGNNPDNNPDDNPDNILNDNLNYNL